MTEFSPQLDMLIEKPNFRGKVHVCADGRTMPDGRPRSVSIPNRTLMAHFSAFSTSAGPCGVYKLGKSVSAFFSALDSGVLISCGEDAPTCDNKKEEFVLRSSNERDGSNVAFRADVAALKPISYSRSGRASSEVC